jgi:hypothetical protein
LWACNEGKFKGDRFSSEERKVPLDIFSPLFFRQYGFQTVQLDDPCLLMQVDVLINKHGDDCVA